MRAILSDTKSDRVYEALRELIVTGQVGPNEKLNISELAQGFGTSEIPVREALKRLQEHRLIKMVPYKGYFVQEYSLEELDDLWAIRGVLEDLAMEKIVARLDGNLPKSLYDLLNRMQQCVAENNIIDYRRLNKIFHLEVYAQSKCKRLIEMLNDVWEEGERAQMTFQIKQDRISESVKEHEELLLALESGNASLAKEVLYKHHQTNMQILKSRL